MTPIYTYDNMIYTVQYIYNIYGTAIINDTRIMDTFKKSAN